MSAQDHKTSNLERDIARGISELKRRINQEISHDESFSGSISVNFYFKLGAVAVTTFPNEPRLKQENP